MRHTQLPEEREEMRRKQRVHHEAERQKRMNKLNESIMRLMLFETFGNGHRTYQRVPGGLLITILVEAHNSSANVKTHVGGFQSLSDVRHSNALALNTNFVAMEFHHI